MVKTANSKKAGKKISADDLRQDLKDFKATKKSVVAMMKVKQSHHAKTENSEDEKLALKSVEDKAKSAIDKLFKGKNKK